MVLGMFTEKKKKGVIPSMWFSMFILTHMISPCQGTKPVSNQVFIFLRKSKGIWSGEVQLWLLKLLVFLVQRFLH